MITCPECLSPIELGSTTCECGWYLKYEPAVEYRLPPEAKWTPPPKPLVGAIKRGMARRAPGPYWTPDRVVNHAQVAHIVRQAQTFGPISVAGRFLQQCIDAGVITSDHRLA